MLMKEESLGVVQVDKSLARGPPSRFHSSTLNLGGGGGVDMGAGVDRAKWGVKCVRRSRAKYWQPTEEKVLEGVKMSAEEISSSCTERSRATCARHAGGVKLRRVTPAVFV